MKTAKRETAEPSWPEWIIFGIVLFVFLQPKPKSQAQQILDNNPPPVN